MRVANLENENRKIVSTMGNFHVLEYARDASVSPVNAAAEYFMGKMGVRRRQIVIDMNGKDTAIIQAGAMQWMAGNVQATTGVKGVGDLFGKMVKGAVTKESAVKPEYTGSGILVLEPTYKYLILLDVGSWGPQGVTLEDGMFYACSGTVKNKVVMRSNLSSAALESNVPYEELVEVELNGDELKIDGNLAVCWSSSLSFTVERSTKTLLGSAVSGEGLVNVYRGTGKVLMCPVAATGSLFAATNNLAPKPGK